MEVWGGRRLGRVHGRVGIAREQVWRANPQSGAVGGWSRRYHLASWLLLLLLRLDLQLLHPELVLHLLLMQDGHLIARLVLRLVVLSLQRRRVLLLLLLLLVRRRHLQGRCRACGRLLLRRHL